MTFKKMRGLDVPYRKQGLIRFVCLDFYNQPPDVRRKISDLCASVGGLYSAALFELMTTENSVRSTALKFHCDETTLYRIRRKFYENF